MDKITAFSITGLTLAGFKSYAQSVELEFGNPTLITGGNACGKSSIADAIAFAVTGLPFFGERGIDRLHAEDNPELYVAMRFLDQQGQEHELIRTRKKGRMSISMDDRELRQQDLTAMFGEKDVFLSIFNPLYFIEELGDDGKHLLERYLPPLPPEQVLSQLDASVHDLLQGENLASPASYLKKRREELRELDEGIIYLSGQKDLLLQQRREQEEKRSALRSRLDKAAAFITELQQRQFSGLDCEAMRQELAGLPARYEQLNRELAQYVDLTPIDDSINAHKLKMKERELEQYRSPHTAALSKLEAQLKELYAGYNKEKDKLQRLAAGSQCPLCRRQIGKGDLPEIKKAFMQELEDIAVRGKQQKKLLLETKEREAEESAAFQQAQTQDLAKLQQQLDAALKARGKATQTIEKNLGSRQAALDEIQERIQSLQADLQYGRLTDAEYDKLQAALAAQEELRRELAALDAVTTQDAADIDADIAKDKERSKQVKQTLSAAALYMSKRAEMLFSQLSLNRVKISLFDVVKSTGEIKDVFRFTYNGRRYDRLSLSEKIRAGMEVSELVKRLSGRNYPVFVDNMESVEELSNVRPSGQIIMAKCLANTPLTVKAPQVKARNSDTKAA